MKQIKSLILKLSCISVFSLLSLTAMAGSSGSNGTVTFAPVDPTAVPTLSSSMLILLSVLLMIVAFRVSKQKGAGKFFVVLLGASVLMASTGGIKLVSDLQASGEISITMPAGDSVDLFPGNFHQIRNQSGVLQRITGIVEPSTCDNFPNGLNIGGPECSVGMTLESDVNSAFCIIDCRTRPIIIDTTIPN